MGRYGKFLACTGYPKCKTTKNLASKSEQADDTARRPGKAMHRKKRASKKTRTKK